MKIIEQHRPDVLELRSGGGIGLLLFSLPFAGVGLFVLYLALFVPGGIPIFFGLPFGSIFLLAGLAAGLGRAGKIIDLRQGTIVAWWGLLAPWRRRTYRLHDFESVTLNREVRQSKNSSYTVYPVRIQGADQKISLGETQDYFKSRRLAGRTAKFLHLPLSDAGLGQERIRSPELLGLSLRQQLLQREAPPALPQPPGELLTTIKRKGNSIMLQTPPRAGRALATAAALAIMLASLILAGAGMAIIRQFELPPVWSWITLLLPPLLGMLLAGKVWRALGPGVCERLIADPETGVTLQKVRAGGQISGLKKIPADELEEVMVLNPQTEIEGPEFMQHIATHFGNRGIAMLSDKDMIKFGKKLSGRELQYLDNLIQATMAS